MIKWKLDCRKQKRKNKPALWLVYSSASASDSDNLVFTWSWAERKCRSRKRSRKKMEPFWFFWLRFRRAYDSAYDSDFWFSLGHKRSYDSAYDSDSVASENQPLWCLVQTVILITNDMHVFNWACLQVSVWVQLVKKAGRIFLENRDVLKSIVFSAIPHF